MRETRLPILLFLVASILITGYDVYIDNHALQLPIVDRIANPSAYPGDPFVDTAPHYASALWHLVAWVSHVVPTMTQLSVLFLIERVLLLVAFARLARAMAPGSRLTELAALAFAALAPRPLIADGTIVTSYLEQTGLSIPIFVLAVASYLERRPYRTALLLGIGFDLNSLYGMYLMTYLIAMAIADGRWRRWWPRWILAAGVFIIAASPGLALSLQAFGRPEPDRDLWLWASRVRFSHHLYPLSWGRMVLVEFGALFALVTAVAWKQRERDPAGAARALAWCATAGGWLALAFLAPVLRSPAVLIAHPGRACDFWQVLAAVYLIAVVARQIEGRRIDPVLGTATLIGAIVVWFEPGFTLVLAGVLCGTLLFAGRPETTLWRRTSPILVALVAIVAIAVPVRRALANLSPQAAFGWRPNAEMLALTGWARENTTRDAVFLVHPTWSEFRPLAQRPVFGTWKDGAAILWDRPYLAQWIERMQAFGLEPGSDVSAKEARAIIANGYAALTDDNVRELRHRYRVAYWVVPHGHHSAFPVAFETNLFLVLSVQDAR